ncbi:MAG: ACP phosphodiesterase [Flavobacteriales bacterium]
MNFLAHLTLGYGNKDWIYGQFIADAVKGKQYEILPHSIKQGVLAHRYVDHQTDSHQATLALRALMREDFGLLTPIVIDVMFDHILAMRWEELFTTSIDAEINHFHDILENHPHPMPARAKSLSQHLIQQQWLKRYATHAGMESTFQQMAKRFPHGANLHHAMTTFGRFEVEIHSTFLLVYPEIRHACEKIMSTFGSHS